MNKPHSHAQENTPGLRAAFFLNLAFTIIEVVGGVYTNSLAILSDSLHDLGDSLSIGFSWLMETVPTAPPKGATPTVSVGFRSLPPSSTPSF